MIMACFVVDLMRARTKIHVLNQQRSRRTEISAEGFEDLALGMGAVLDKCRQSKDVHTAKMAMMLSQVIQPKNASFTLYLCKR